MHAVDAAERVADLAICAHLAIDAEGGVADIAPRARLAVDAEGLVADLAVDDDSTLVTIRGNSIDAACHLRTLGFEGTAARVSAASPAAERVR